MSTSETTLAEILKRLENPHLKEIDLSLGRMERLLVALGHPERRLPPVIHVAGTNGKGSLVAYLQAIFKAAGYRVHRYTSPHLVTFNERIVINHQPIGDEELLSLLRHVEAKTRDFPATFFESTTAVAFLAFAETPADILLLEVGLGGRLDATNVVTQPVLTAITPISFDHQEYLGSTLSAIATEKAGILKPGFPCVVGAQEPEALDAIECIAKERDVELYRYAREWQIKSLLSGFRYQSPKREITASPGLVGEHQHHNAGAAIACIDQLPQFNINDEHIRDGLAKIIWPARLQRLTQGPLMTLLPRGAELWLDGGHNPAAGQVLARWLAADNNSCPTYIISGMVKGKDSEGFYAALAPHITRFFAMTIPEEGNSKTAEEIRQSAVKAGMPGEVASGMEDAVYKIARVAGDRFRIVIAGSLYLAGHVLKTHQ